MKAVKFLDLVSTVLQSKRELYFDQSFYLATIIVKAIRNGVCRTLQFIFDSRTMDKKWCYLIHLNNSHNNLCFAGSLRQTLQL